MEIDKLSACCLELFNSMTLIIFKCAYLTFSSNTAALQHQKLESGLRAVCVKIQDLPLQWMRMLVALSEIVME